MSLKENELWRELRELREEIRLLRETIARLMVVQLGTGYAPQWQRTDHSDTPLPPWPEVTCLSGNDDNSIASVAYTDGHPWMLGT